MLPDTEKLSKSYPKNSLLYQKSDLNIFIIFFNGNADAIAYGKIAKGQQFSENEIEILLKSNSGGVPWQKRDVISMKGNWEIENGEVLATYLTFENLLLVGTKDHLAREKAEKASQKVMARLLSAKEPASFWTDPVQFVPREIPKQNATAPWID